jgi:hypothetical protein
MESIIRDVTALDETQRRALEGVVGRELLPNERLVINVLEVNVPPRGNRTAGQPRQSLDDWTSIYVGLNEDQIRLIDMVATTRANLTRHIL